MDSVKVLCQSSAEKAQCQTLAEELNCKDCHIACIFVNKYSRGVCAKEIA